MHVGRGAGDLAQRGRFELAMARAGVGEAAIAPGDAGVVQPLVGEVWADMTRGTVCLPAKELKARRLPGRQSSAVAVDEAVEGRIAGENRPDETRQRARDL